MKQTIIIIVIIIVIITIIIIIIIVIIIMNIIIIKLVRVNRRQQPVTRRRPRRHGPGGTDMYLMFYAQSTAKGHIRVKLHQYSMHIPLLRIWRNIRENEVE